jgi:DNA-binding CsgD family transcriptional regulator
LLAFEDAVQFFQTALDAIEQRADPDEAARCRLLLLLGEAQRKSNDFPKALSTLGEAAKTASGLGLPEVLAQAALAYEQTSWRAGLFTPDPPPRRLLEEALREVPERKPALRARLMGALGRALLYAGAEFEGRAQVAKAIAMARQVGDPAVLAANISRLFTSFWGPESTEELLRSATEMLAAAAQSGELELLYDAYGWRLPLYLELGEIAGVDADLGALTGITDRLRQRTYSIQRVCSHVMLALMRGEFADAEKLILKVQGLLVAEHSDLLGMQIFTLRRDQGRLAALQPVVSTFLRQQSAASVWRPGLALIYVELDKRDDARAEFEELAADDFAAIPRDGRWLYCMVYLSEVCAALGDAARAATLYRLLSPYSGHNIVFGAGIACGGSADRYLGLLCGAMARWPEAQQHFEAALTMNELIGARVAQAYTRHDYAAMLLARGETADRERAISLLRASLEAAREIGMKALEERAARCLDESSARPGEGASLPDDLTAREAEVLRLIAIGRSNADIATALSISLNTVATHVRNILAKTGCANRTEAAAYAMRHGLAPH